MTGPRVYMKGNEALAIGALKAHLNAYFAYPITPSSEIPETLAREFGNPEYPDFKVFLQSASELEAINMVIGAAATGARAMTATSSPGMSLNQEGLSYAAGMELPFVVVNVMRSGPGLGNLGPEQSDYFQATRGGGHGSYRLIVLAPYSVQEMASFSFLAFDLAFKYRNPVIIVSDAFTGQLKEDITFPEIQPQEYDTSGWTTTGAKGRRPHVLSSLELDLEQHYKTIARLDTKFKEMAEKEVRFEEYLIDDAERIVVAYGIAARIAKKVVHVARQRGIKAGLFRPITLWPFPRGRLNRLARDGKRFLVVELSIGQLLEDVMSAVEGRSEVGFVSKYGGLFPSEDEVLAKLMAVQEVVAK